MGLVLVSFMAPVFGQVAAPAQQNFPVLPPLPRPYLLNPPPASAPKLKTEGEGLPFHHWRELLAKNDTVVPPGPINLKLDLTASGWGAPDHCSIPLVEIPLPEHFDDGMVREMPPHRDDKMAITPPPVCQLHTANANPHKRK
jgi:hypothetical protein